MQEYILKVLKADFVTHDVKRFILERPPGYTFIPGQGTDVAINLPEWKDKFRPFTFTSAIKWPYLELTIKIYEERNGVTKQFLKVNAGQELILKEPYGMITFKRSGVFIAGGSGITPFISIFRSLSDNAALLNENLLIYSNKNEDDVIYEDELSELLKDKFVRVFTHDHSIGFLERRIDRRFLIEHISDFGQQFYVCGPQTFVTSITGMLQELGADPNALIF